MVGDWETLQEEHILRTQALASQRSLEMAPDPTPLPSTQLHRVQALVHVGEYVRTMCALAPNTLIAPSTETIVAFRHLHPLVEVDLPPFVNNFHPKTNLVLDRKTFFLL
jgi:hypothetical protein